MTDDRHDADAGELAEQSGSLLGVPPAPDWLTDRGHPDACGACGHPHVNGRSGTCSRFTCPCRTWRAPARSDGDREAAS